MLSLPGALPPTERTLQQLNSHACESAISFCELLGSCCFVTILLAADSKDKIPTSVSAAVEKRCLCDNCPRQQAAGTLPVANLQIRLGGSEPRLRQISGRLSNVFCRPFDKDAAKLQQIVKGRSPERPSVSRGLLRPCANKQPRDDGTSQSQRCSDRHDESKSMHEGFGDRVPNRLFSHLV